MVWSSASKKQPLLMWVESKSYRKTPLLKSKKPQRSSAALLLRDAATITVSSQTYIATKRLLPFKTAQILLFLSMKRGALDSLLRHHWVLRPYARSSKTCLLSQENAVMETNIVALMKRRERRRVLRYPKRTLSPTEPGRRWPISSTKPSMKCFYGWANPASWTIVRETSPCTWKSRKWSKMNHDGKKDNQTKTRKSSQIF